MCYLYLTDNDSRLQKEKKRIKTYFYELWRIFLLVKVWMSNTRPQCKSLSTKVVLYTHHSTLKLSNIFLIIFVSNLLSLSDFLTSKHKLYLFIASGDVYVSAWISTCRINRTTRDIYLNHNEVTLSSYHRDYFLLTLYFPIEYIRMYTIC